MNRDFYSDKVRDNVYMPMVRSSTFQLIGPCSNIGNYVFCSGNAERKSVKTGNFTLKTATFPLI